MKRRFLMESREPTLWDWLKESPEAIVLFLASMICLFFWPHIVFHCVRVVFAAIYAVLESLRN
jgi:hypothetical protein